MLVDDPSSGGAQVDRNAIGIRLGISCSLGALLALSLALQPAAAVMDDLGQPLTSTPSSEDAPLQDLMSLLDQETELATRRRMNADFIPGMATILRGEDLLARGVRNVGEALALVPGISEGLEMTGERQILSRGVGFGYASGNLKILLDGVSMNATLNATANPVLDIPIEQVERIEVIRGPGASVHGEYAFAGVIDVITRKGRRELNLQAMEGADRGGGGIWHWDDTARDLRVSVNLLGLDGDGGVRVAEDALHAVGRPELSNAPGPSNESHRYRGLFAELTWGELFAAVKLLDDDYGDHFGINHFLPPDDDRLASRQGYQSLQLGANRRLAEDLSARLRLEALQYQRARDRLYVFPGGLISANPVFMDQDYRETRYLGAADLNWLPHPRHAFLLGLEASQVKVDEATWEWPAELEIDDPWLDDGRNRRILSLVAQDQFSASDRITLTGTLRHDDYSDSGSHTSPRLAAVWRLDEQHVLKLQYAQAFRPPTFYELQYPARGSIEAGQIATYELGYILKKPRWETRLTLFRSNLRDPIVFSDDEAGYINSDEAHLQGVELEYQARLAARVRLDANLSYVDAVDRNTDSRLPGGTALLGNLALLWKPLETWTAALQLRYVGERERALGDERAPLPGDTLVDLTLSYGDGGRGPFAHVGVKNLTDAEVRYPDQSTSLGATELPYPDDYPRPGRRFWLSIGYAF